MSCRSSLCLFCFALFRFRSVTTAFPVYRFTPDFRQVLLKVAHSLPFVRPKAQPEKFHQLSFKARFSFLFSFARIVLSWFFICFLLSCVHLVLLEVLVPSLLHAFVSIGASGIR